MVRSRMFRDSFWLKFRMECVKFMSPKIFDFFIDFLMFSVLGSRQITSIWQVRSHKNESEKKMCSGFLEHQEELAKTVQNLACMHNS